MKYVIIAVAAVILSMVSKFYVQLDTYTATVASAAALDTDTGRTSKFVRVKPELGARVRGVDNSGILKLKISDIHVPYFAWATDNDRADNLKPGDVICLTDSGYRSNFMSEYPILVTYKEGPCRERRIQ